MTATVPLAMEAATVRAFVRSARAVRRRAGALHLGLLAALPCIAVLLLAALVHPLLPVLLWPWGLALVLVAALAGFVRGGLVPARALLQDLPAGARARSAPLGDALATWLEQERRHTADRPMARWLCSDLARELGAVPAPDLRRLGRRRLGRIRYLLPVCVLLLLALWLLRWWPPEVPGLLGGGGAGAGGPTTAGAAGGAATGNGAGETPSPLPPPPEPDAGEPPADQPEADPPEPEPPAAVPPEPPAPLVPLPSEQQFTVPQFIDDGPSRRELARVARQGDGGAGAGAAAGRADAGRGAGETAPLPASDPEAFTRAAEAALRARHVPEAERAMVRRFFQLLTESGR